MTERKTKLLDVTMRDGGLTNEFFFEDDFVRALFRMNLLADVDYMEIGYRASMRMFRPEDFGKWKFCADEDILRVLGEDAGKKIKLSVMADAGRCDYKNDIRPRSDSPVTLIRVACYFEQLREAVSMIEDISRKGYEVSCNLMAVSALSEAQIRQALTVLAASPVDMIYIVDSFGALLPTDIARLTNLFMEYASPHGKLVGMHAHDNLSNALANTLLSRAAGATLLDAAYGRLGRGAGSCSMSGLMGCLGYPADAVRAALEFTDACIVPLKEKGAYWGADPAYALTALMNRHPRDAIAYRKAGRSDLMTFYDELTKEG